MKTMLSRQEMARNKQNYTSIPSLPLCENCNQYRSVWVQDDWGNREEKKRRCFIGGFAVKRKGNCNLHSFKMDEAEHDYNFDRR